MTGRITKTVAAVALVGLTAAGAATMHAQAQPEGRRNHRMFGRGFGAERSGVNLRALNLTDEQRGQVRAIYERHRAELRTAQQRLGAASRAQQDAVTAVPTDEGLIRSTGAELATAQTEAALVRARVHSDVYQVLTPEQQAKAKELKAQREARRAQTRERVEQRRQQRQQQQSQPPR